MLNQTLAIGGEVDCWEQAIDAFLAEKERRSGSLWSQSVRRLTQSTNY